MSANEAAPSVSVIIPMYNAEVLIERCSARSLRCASAARSSKSSLSTTRSTDRSAELVRAHPSVRLVSMAAQGGPGAARNRGAEVATGTHLWFVDSDVIVADDAARVLRDALKRTRAAAVIGSYDNRPAAGNFLSQYKNLVHHYYHHRGKEARFHLLGRVRCSGTRAFPADRRLRCEAVSLPVDRGYRSRLPDRRRRRPHRSRAAACREST